jgi:hypothetical protein
MQDTKAEIQELVVIAKRLGGDDDLDAVEAQLEALEKKLAIEAVSAFETVVADIRKRDGCSGTEALQKARLVQPELFESYQRSAVERPIHKTASQSKSVQEFETLISEIAARDRIGRSQAMQRARQENTAAFEAYQN